MQTQSPVQVIQNLPGQDSELIQQLQELLCNTEEGGRMLLMPHTAEPLLSPVDEQICDFAPFAHRDLSEYDPHEVALDALESTLVELRDAFDREDNLIKADKLAGKILRHEAKIELLRDSWG